MKRLPNFLLPLLNEQKLENIVVTLENQIKTALDKFIATQNKELSKKFYTVCFNPR